MPDSVWRYPLQGTTLTVLADCHIHEGGPQFPPALFPKLQGVDLIVTLGDMGDSSALDQLQEIARVLGVRGQDDAEDIRTRRFALRGDRAEAAAAVRQMIAWNPERVILAHGRWYDGDGVAELKRAFRWLL